MNIYPHAPTITVCNSRPIFCGI